MFPTDRGQDGDQHGYAIKPVQNTTHKKKKQNAEIAGGWDTP